MKTVSCPGNSGDAGFLGRPQAVPACAMYGPAPKALPFAGLGCQLSAFGGRKAPGPVGHAAEFPVKETGTPAAQGMGTIHFGIKLLSWLGDAAAPWRFWSQFLEAPYFPGCCFCVVFVSFWKPMSVA